MSSQTSDRFVSTFALTEAFECNVSYDYQIERKFPLPGVSLEGYCGEKFASTPPLSAPQALNSKYNVDNNTTEHFIECRGTPQVISSSFLSGVPWIIPFCISSIKDADLFQLIYLLPEDIEVYGHKYCFGGFTMIQSGHITAVIVWKGEFFLYDGMKHNDTERFRPIMDSDFSNQEGSTVTFLLN